MKKENLMALLELKENTDKKGAFSFWFRGRTEIVNSNNVLVKNQFLHFSIPSSTKSIKGFVEIEDVLALIKEEEYPSLD